MQQKLMNLLWEGKSEESRRLLRPERLVGGPAGGLREILVYLEENWDGIYGSRGSKDRIGSKEALGVGSGRMETNADLMLAASSRARGRGGAVLKPRTRQSRGH